jgi:hypothetical protein
MLLEVIDARLQEQQQLRQAKAGQQGGGAAAAGGASSGGSSAAHSSPSRDILSLALATSNAGGGQGLDKEDILSQVGVCGGGGSGGGRCTLCAVCGMVRAVRWFCSGLWSHHSSYEWYHVAPVGPASQITSLSARLSAVSPPADGCFYLLHLPLSMLHTYADARKQAAGCWPGPRGSVASLAAADKLLAGPQLTSSWLARR